MNEAQEGRLRVSPHSSFIIFSLLLEVIRALLVAGHHVQQAVAVDVGHFELRADARVVVDLVLGPLRACRPCASARTSTSRPAGRSRRRPWARGPTSACR